MRRFLATFGGKAYDQTTQLIVERALTMGATDLCVYDDAWLMAQKGFCDLNRWLFLHHGDRENRKRGAGCWFAFKPFVLMHMMSRMGDGDMVLFLDADTFPVAPFGCLYDYCAQAGTGFFLFESTGNGNRRWVKEDCWLTMAAEVRAEGRRHVERDSSHAVARFMLFQKGPWAVQQFLAEWLTYCVNPLATTFDPSVIAPDPPELMEHRTEQAIFTLLAHKYGIPLHREADAFGNSVTIDWELYPQLFEQRYCLGDRSDLSGSRFRNV